MENQTHQIANKTWDATVIGGGLAGLTAAIYLARSGKSVLILEKSDRLGGRAATDEKSDCFFNLGPHALYKKGAGIKVLRELGISPDGGAPSLKGTLIYKGKPYTMTPFSLLTSRLFSWREKKELVRFMGNLFKIDVTSIEHISLQDWLLEQLQGERARNYVLTLCRVASYTNEPELVSAGVIMKQLRASFGGVTYLHGGWQTLVNALTEKALEVGVTILQQQNVTEISGTKPEMLITLADQKQISTRSVISTVSPTSTYNMVRDAEHTSLADLKETLIPVKGACLDIALKRLPVPQTTFALSIDAPMYFSNHSAVAKLSRNPEHVVVHAFKYLRSQVEQNPIQDRLEIEAFLDQIQPGWQKELITSRYLPSMTVSHGLVTAERGKCYREEGTAVPDIPGLYIAGDWLAKDGLLADASISSAKEAAMTMIQN